MGVVDFGKFLCGRWLHGGTEIGVGVGGLSVAVGDEVTNRRLRGGRGEMEGAQDRLLHIVCGSRLNSSRPPGMTWSMTLEPSMNLKL